MNRRAENRAYYLANKEKILSRNTAYRRNHILEIGIAKRSASRLTRAKFSTLRCRGKKHGIEVSITFEDFSTLNALPCDYCGGVLPATGYGIDRKDNTRGYTPDNCLPCCANCNTMKGALLTYEEMKLVWAYRKGK